MMFALADVTIDRHLLDIVSLIGLVLGIVGGLFFTYDLLGRPGGPLRWSLRLLVPASVGLLILAVPATTIVALLGQMGTPNGTNAILVFAFFGVTIGSMNALFVSAPGAEVKRRWPLSARDALLGFAVTVVYAVILEVLSAALTGPSSDPIGEAIDIAGIALGGGIVASFWRVINRSQPTTSARPRLFSGRGFLIGMLTGVSFLTLAIFLAFYVFARTGGSDNPIIALIVSLLFGLVLGALPGGLSGGFSRYAFWWANNLPDRGLEVIGILLVLLAFAAQTVQPVLDLFNVVAK
jgi:hypothetical protein